MSQATQRRISEKVKSLRESDALPFHEILDPEMVKSALAGAGVTYTERIYTPFVTLCMFLWQVLDPDHSCSSAVARLIVWMVLNGRKPCSPDSTSYTPRGAERAFSGRGDCDRPMRLTASMFIQKALPCKEAHHDLASHSIDRGAAASR
jgi:hypothetical protein